MRKEKQSQPGTISRWGLRYCPWESKAMISGTQNRTKGGKAPGRGGVSGWARGIALAVLVLGVSAPASYAGRVGWGQRPRAQAARPAPMRPAPRQQAARPAQPGKNNGNNANVFRPAGNPPEMRPGTNGNPAMVRPGGNGVQQPGHLGQWLNNHQNLTPQQQEDQLRREPGFNRLSPEQQQRVVDRLHSLDQRPPEQRQRLVDRNEMFERLTPQQKQDVRGSFQQWNQMAPDRHRMVGRAFTDLRQIPPDQRAQILNSARFAQQFTPDERRVLGNLLSIEPYEQR